MTQETIKIILALVVILFLLFLLMPTGINRAAAHNCDSICTSHVSIKKHKPNKVVLIKKHKKHKIAAVHKRQKNILEELVEGIFGLASFYSKPQPVASGGRFNPKAMTAAHKTLPFGTKVKVTNKRNGKSVVVTINDRGPYVKGRIIDLSLAAAKKIGMTNSGVVPIRITRAPIRIARL